MVVLFLILTIFTPTTFAEFTGEGSPLQDFNPPPPSPPPPPPPPSPPPPLPEQTIPSPDPPGRLLKRQPPPIAPVQMDIPRHRLRPPPIDDGTGYTPSP